MMSDTGHAPDISLLWPPGIEGARGSAEERWGEHTAHDLGLDTIAGRISPDTKHVAAVRTILAALCTDTAVIHYRQAVLEDILRSTELAAGLAALVPSLAELGRLNGPASMQRTLLHQTVWRLGELDLYVDVIERLRALLAPDGCAPRAEAFTRLRARLDAVAADPTFQALAAALPELRISLHNVASVTIGVNLDDEMRPVEATLLSVNARSFKGKDESLLHRLLSSTGDDYRGIAQLHTVANKQMSFINPSMPGLSGNIPTAERENPLLVPLFRDLDAILKETIRPVAQGLRRFVHVRTSFLAALEPELVFFLGAAEMIRAVQAAGLPMCRPDIAPTQEHACRVRDLYNVNLALRVQSEQPGATLAEEIVPNEALFGPEGRIFILTGPNRGGKTTYVQAVGLAHVLAQAGLHVPGAQARISPVDGIYTHFPVEEQLQYDLGRLGEEARRLGTIFDRATADSLVLLNESLSTTSPAESLVLAADVVRALRLLGARAIFATHLHELAADLERLNAEAPPGAPVVSLVAGVAAPDAGGDGEAATRTYKITPAPPMGLSYARDIARRYGISFEQLRDKLRERGALGDGGASTQAG